LPEETEQTAGERGRRLAAIMFTDMVGYTALTQSNESLALEVLERHNRLLRPLFPKYGGKEIKTIGDSFLVEFGSALDATRCAIEIQKYLHEYNVSALEDSEIKLRIGIHLGDVIQRNGDIFGDAVNIASRIQPTADPEGVCVSEQVFAQIHNKLSYSFQPLHHTQLKDVAYPTKLYKIVMPWEAKNIGRKQHMQTVFDRKRIAVLPFSNISPDPNDEYFADGMTEEMISTLSNIQGLNVISRTSVLHYRNAGKRASEISQELGAGTLMEGSVRKSANKVRITVQLIDAKEDRHLWSEKYDRELGDVFTIQSEIAQQVARALRAGLLSSAEDRIRKGNTRSTKAHTEFLKGRYHMNRATNEEWFQATEYLGKAIQEDPNYALAYAALSECYTYLAGTALGEREGFEKAKQFALKAIELDDKLAEGHASLAMVALQHDWDWVKTENEFRRAIKLNPSYSTAHMWYGIYLALAQESEQGISELRLAEDLDPLSPFIKLNLAVTYYNARRNEEAKAKLEELNELEKENHLACMALGLVYLRESKFDDALKELNKAVALGGTPIVLGALGYAQAISGKKKEALETLAKLSALESPGTSHATEAAMIHLGLGEMDRALESLERAFQQRESWLILSHGFPIFEALATDQRYLKLVQKMGLSR
jgi:adenylate cyclase